MYFIMIVIFKTNLDQYQGEHFGSRFGWKEAVPRVGDLVEVRGLYYSHFQSKKMPTRLEVVRVTWQEVYDDIEVTVELWYNKLDLELAKNAGAPVFG